MRLAEQWEGTLEALRDGWTTARVALTLADEAEAERAALILGPAAPGRSGTTFRIEVRRGSASPGPRPDAVRRALQRLDREGIRGDLELVEAEAAAVGGGRARARPALAAQWDALLERFPSDWSDVYAELELDSTDFLDRGAVLLAPVNPARYGGARGLRFRCARSFGYGVSAGMARRCLERLDAETITGTIRILRVLSKTAPVGTQGPIFRIGGRSV